MATTPSRAEIALSVGSCVALWLAVIVALWADWTGPACVAIAVLGLGGTAGLMVSARLAGEVVE
jgi:ribose/xylose/arabinose/galactoside ABC-type transport system permease subunit